MKRYFIYFLSVAFCATFSCVLTSCSDDDDEPKDSGVILGYEYVDLGLPSGTLWATCNVGASKPEEYGDYFAWGDTMGYDHGNKDFKSRLYKWCDKGYFEQKLTKYCMGEQYGTVDGLSVLKSEDDMATARMGDKWQTPSKDQFEELINAAYTDVELTELNGVKCMKITSKKKGGKSIFLPAAGFRSDEYLNGVGEFGDYWTRTLYVNQSFHAYDMSFGNDFITGEFAMDVAYVARACGRSVRAVVKK